MPNGKWAGSNYFGRKSRLPKNWPVLRLEILARDNYVCQVCHGPGADGVDHIIANDDHSPANLRAIHHAVYPYCHRHKSSSEGGHAKAKFNSPKRSKERHPGLL